MTKQEITENISIARGYLDRFHILIPDDRLIMDCCFLPPYRWTAFYMQIEPVNGVYRACCAYTRYMDHFGNKSRSQPFTVVEEADRRAHLQGDVFCKIVYPPNRLVDKITEQAMSYVPVDCHDEEGIVIDGISARVRLFDKGLETLDVCMINDSVPLLETVISLSETI